MSTRKSVRLQQKINTPKTPIQTNFYSPRLRNSVKRNLNSSFGATEECFSPTKVSKNKESDNEEDRKSDTLTLVINKKSLTCRPKYFYESCSDSENESSENYIVITGEKRKNKTSKKDDSKMCVSPIKITVKVPEELHKTPIKNKLFAKDVFNDIKTPKNSHKRATPKSTNKFNKEVNISNEIYRTPVNNKFLEKDNLNDIKTPQSSIKKATPRSTIKLIRDGIITPKIQSRNKAMESENTPLKQARNHLHVSYVPTNLPCREKEHEDILSFLEGKLLDGCGGCMYISGVPGTGKTATVTRVINYLLDSAKAGDVPSFQYVNINGMKLTEPRQAYVEVVRQLSGKTVSWEQAHLTLEEKFTKKSKKEKLPIILLVDELDIICTKRQDVVYNILDWPTKASTQLIVITIANTMDLPERLLMNRVTSRLGLTRLTFQAYTHKQLQEIVTKRLVGTNSFNPDAIQLVARKVASVSGDARRALDICRRAAEIAELKGSHTVVTISHVNDALKAMITQPKVRAIKSCSRLEQYVLQAIISEVERTGVEETVFSDVYKMLGSLCTLNGFDNVSCSVALRTVSRLGACRLLLIDQKCHDIDQRIILNVSPDDVYYALREE